MNTIHPALLYQGTKSGVSLKRPEMSMTLDTCHKLTRNQDNAIIKIVKLVEHKV